MSYRSEKETRIVTKKIGQAGALGGPLQSAWAAGVGSYDAGAWPYYYFGTSVGQTHLRRLIYRSDRLPTKILIHFTWFCPGAARQTDLTG